MATHDYVIANASGAAVRSDLNDALAAIVSNNSSSSEPATTYAYQFWADTSNNVLKIRNSANNAWITLRELDGTMLLEDGSASTPGLAFADDVNTGIFSPAADQIGFATGGVERLEIGSSEVVFNDPSNDVDFRVESNGQTHMLFVDAGNDRIGIGDSAPGTFVEAHSTAPHITFRNTTEEDTDGGRETRLIFEGEQSGGEISTLVQIEASHDGTADDERGKLVISTNDGSDGASPTEALRIDRRQSILIGQSSTTTPGYGNTTLGAAFENLGSDGTALFVSRSGNVAAGFSRAQDGNILDFSSAGSIEGNISISGTTTSYNGAHLSRWSQLAGGAERIEILRGSVLSNIDEMCEWGEEDNEQLNRMKVSDVEGDVNVSGVFQAWDDDDDTYTNDFYCAMTGDFIIRIAQGTTVARGDLLMSAGDGTAKPQDDDIVRSKTIAKVTSTTVSTTYADGSYCVPCVLMAC